MNFPNEEINKKIVSQNEALEIREGWASTGLKTVFTNGCFDILHFGHFHYLCEAANLGDKLIIGLNSQQSVSRLKGSHRPIQDEATRLFALASLQFVDLVVVFDLDTPLSLITLLKPDVLVKGGDWQPSEIIGSGLVLNNGGEVKSLPFVSGYSTTSIEKKIKDSDI